MKKFITTVILLLILSSLMFSDPINFTSTSKNIKVYIKTVNIEKIQKVKKINIINYNWNITIIEKYTQRLFYTNYLLYVIYNSRMYKIIESGKYKIKVKIFFNIKSKKIEYSHTYWCPALFKIKLPIILKEPNTKHKKNKERKRII